MKLLVTGGAGFIGSNFIHYIADTYPSYEVLNVDLLTYAGNRANLDDLPISFKHRLIRADITDFKTMCEVSRGVDAIIHFAAESHVDRSISDPGLFLKTNVLGTESILRAALVNNVPRLHHVSTDEVYGQLSDTGAFNEHTPYAPRSPYAASKAASDHIVSAYFHTYALPITISNCSNNFGPWQFPEKFIPLSITNLMQDKKIPVYGKGMNIRDWLFVDDHSRALDLILHHGTIGQTYCIGGGTEMRNIDIAKALLEAFGKNESMIEFVEDRKGHDYRYAIDSTKIAQELGWAPQSDFRAALTATIQWYRDHEQWWQAIASGAYQDYNSRVPSTMS